MTCETGTHERVVQDKFSIELKIHRTVPGDCYCLDCSMPLPAWWNGGRIERIEMTAEQQREIGLVIE